MQLVAIFSTSSSVWVYPGFSVQWSFKAQLKSTPKVITQARSLLKRTSVVKQSPNFRSDLCHPDTFRHRTHLGRRNPSQSMAIDETLWGRVDADLSHFPCDMQSLRAERIRHGPPTRMPLHRVTAVGQPTKKHISRPLCNPLYLLLIVVPQSSADLLYVLSLPMRGIIVCSVLKPLVKLSQ